MNNLVKQLREQVVTQVVPVLRQFETEYVNDAYATTLEQVFENLRKGFEGIDTQAKVVSSEFVGQVDAQNKKRFYSAIERSVGVSVQNIVQNEGLNDILVAKTRENVSLIKSIPDEYFKKIETVVFEGTTNGQTATSLVKEIQKIGKTTQSRAKLIARDQTAKINAVLTQQRAQNLGVEEFVWKTAGDERVRASHVSKNNKTFRYDDPPKDTGLPGQDIQCRCIAQPVIKF